MTGKEMNRRIRKALRDTHGNGPAAARRGLNKRRPHDPVTHEEIDALTVVESWKAKEDLRRQNKFDACVECERMQAESEGREMRPMLVWMEDKRVNQ